MTYRMHDIHGCGTLDIRLFDQGATLRIAYEESTKGVEAMEAFSQSIQKVSLEAWARAHEKGYVPK